MALRASLGEELAVREAEAARLEAEYRRRELERQMLINRNLEATAILLDSVADTDVVAEIVEK